MNKYKLGMELVKNKNQEVGIVDKIEAKKEKNKKINYFKEAINYFIESKKINDLLGINQIKIIYTLIMISKCYTQINDYRQAMNYIKKHYLYFLNFQNLLKIIIQNIIIRELCYL